MNPNEKLAKIKKILLHGEQKPFNAYDDMAGALYDLERAGHIADDVVVKTLKFVQQQIGEVIKILEEPDTWDEDGPLSASISDISEGAHQDDWSHPKIEDKEH